MWDLSIIGVVSDLDDVMTWQKAKPTYEDDMSNQPHQQIVYLKLTHSCI